MMSKNMILHNLSNKPFLRESCSVGPTDSLCHFLPNNRLGTLQPLVTLCRIRWMDGRNYCKHNKLCFMYLSEIGQY